MNYFKGNIILLILITFSIGRGQDIYNIDNYFYSIFENADRVNPYFLVSNPAFLEYDNRDELLEIQSVFDNSSGNFKQFIEPENTRLYQLIFSGKKSVDTTLFFKGYFAIQRTERDSWHWITTKSYNIGSPFLLGDSTTGRSRYNGFYMKAEYSQKFFNRFLFGVSLGYYVDEGLKEVSPRPVSLHREIDLSIGIGYLLNKNISTGASFRTFDFTEEIKYREDEGSILNETIIFKFRGYDYPMVLSKKVETRFSYHNGYYGSFDLGYLSNEQFSASLYAKTGFEHLTIRDDAINPQSEGYWEKMQNEVGLQVSYSLTNYLKAGLWYSFLFQDMWAKHPDFNVLLMELENPNHKVYGGLEYAISRDLVLGLEAGIKMTKIDCNDYYSNILWSVDGNEFGSRIGIGYRWSDHVSIFLASGVSKYFINNSDLQTPISSERFRNSRIADILYHQTEYYYYNIYLKTAINSNFLGQLNIYINYDSYNAENSSFFGLSDYHSLKVILELRLKAY